MHFWDDHRIPEQPSISGQPSFAAEHISKTRPTINWAWTLPAAAPPPQPQRYG
jgi:hypothetical protein